MYKCKNTWLILILLSHLLNSCFSALTFLTIQEISEFPAASSTEVLIGIGLGFGFGGSINIYLKKGTFIV